MARMSTLLIVGAVTVAVGAGVVYYGYKKGVFKKKSKNVKQICNLEIKKIEGALSFTDVVGWFKKLSLDSQKDTPFVALADKFEEMFASYFKTENMMVYPPLPNDTFNRPDNKRLLLGVYDEKANEINKALLIIADAFDEKTLEFLGNESLVVLS